MVGRFVYRDGSPIRAGARGYFFVRNDKFSSWRCDPVKRQILFGGLLMTAIGIIGCGGDGTGGGGGTGTGGGGGAISPSDGGGTAATTTDESATDAAPKGDKQAWDDSMGTATIKGVVKLTGEAPKRRPIDMAGKAECAKLHSDAVLDESTIVDANGALKNVLVWVKRGLGDYEYPLPTEPAVINQKGCMFTPHVMAMRLGQELAIRNSDAFAHNVHALPKRNDSFNFTQGEPGREDKRLFSRAETMIYFKCDIHGWMSSYISVIDHPFYVVTGDDGTFELPKLPPGEYTIEAEHEALGKKNTKVTVADGDSQEIEFSFEDE